MFAYVGGYTTADRDGRGDGINVYRVDPSNLEWHHIQHVGNLENPSLFTLNRAATRLYTVHGARPLLSCFAIDHDSGRIAMLNQINCGGTNPVDSALSPDERSLIVANYGTGSVAVVSIDETGALGEVVQSITLQGQHGPHPIQQTSSHPHAVIFDPTGRFVIVPDKGLDCTFFFRFVDGRLYPMSPDRIASAAGAAPRHARFHPTLPILYVNNELDSTVTVFEWNDGVAQERQVIRTLTTHNGTNTTAEIDILPSGRILYVSNRGEDSIARFRVAPETGRLTYLGHTSSGGARPRFFTLDQAAEHLYVANQDSDSITAFRIEGDDGNLMPTGSVLTVGSPSALSFVLST